jgi:putative heme-binding domain-containing protein
LIVAALSKGNGVKSPAATVALLETLKGMASSHASKALQQSMRGLKQLLNSENEAIAILAAENLGAWNARKVGGDLTHLVMDGDRQATIRRSAAVALAKLGNKEDVATLVRLSSDGDPKTRYVALAGLVTADLGRGVELATQLFGVDPGDTNPVPIVQAILKNRKGGKVLADAMKGVEIHPVVRSRVSEFHRASGLLPTALAELFRASSGAYSLSALLLIEDPQKLTRDVELYGDAARGETIYRRKALSCTNCHAIGPVGSQIGPNLVAVGAAAKTGYIVESILQPNKAIAEHYENRLFVLVDGTIQTGIVTFKSDKQIVVRDAAQSGKEVQLAVDDIVAEKAMVSAMPAGLADQLSSRQEFLDLAKFVSVLGKPGAYANDESPVIRKWSVIAAPSSGEIPSDDAQWITASSKVSGVLPSEDLPLGDRVLARGYVNVQVAGSMKLKINEIAGLQIWIDEIEMNRPSDTIDLAKGRRTLTFLIDRVKRGDTDLRVELVTAPGSPIKFQPEGGL